MALLSWPEWMPRPQVSQYGIHPLDRRQNTETEAGAITRVQFDTDECEAECTLVLSREKAAWFEVFERDMLRQGSTWFKMPLWVAGRVEEHEVQFKERPAAGNLIGLYTAYSFTLRVARRHFDLDPALAAELMSLNLDELLAAGRKLPGVLPAAPVFNGFVPVDFSTECAAIAASNGGC